MVAKRYQSPHVVVCIPSMGTWTAETSRCMALMFSDFAQRKVKGAHSQKMSIISAQGSMLGQLREMMVMKALQSEASHLLFIDSDMKFPMNTARTLLEHRKPFVGANCTTRVHPVEPVAHDLQGNRLLSKGKHGLQKVQHVGLAMTMVEADAIKELRPPLFLQDWIPDIRKYCGEDVYFCQKLVATGVDLYVDHDLSRNIGHVGSYTYGHDDIEVEPAKKVSNG